MPSLASREALLVLGQGVLLVSRTLLTEWIARVEGWSGSSLVSLVGGVVGVRVTLEGWEGPGGGQFRGGVLHM